MTCEVSTKVISDGLSAIFWSTAVNDFVFRMIAGMVRRPVTLWQYTLL